MTRTGRIPAGRPAGDAVAHAEFDGRAPAEFGEQTEEVLAEFGFGNDEIAELRQRKVV